MSIGIARYQTLSPLEITWTESVRTDNWTGFIRDLQPNRFYFGFLSVYDNILETVGKNKRNMIES